MKHLKLILPLFLILFACSPDADDTIEDTRLELTVLDESSAAIENVEVKLYASQEDYDNDTNIIATSATDATGKVTFEKLQSITYFWKTTADCYLENAINNTVNPIVGNTLNLFSTNLISNSFGDIAIVNNSSYDYEVSYSFDGANYSIITSTPSFANIIEGVPSGIYYFVLTPLDGPITTPIYLTEILECGGYIDIQID